MTVKLQAGTLVEKSKVEEKQKKMMILGASALQVPAIKKAKELGYQIILVDYDENAVGFALADVKLVVSTLDQEEVYRQALIYQPDVVITSTSDGPVRTAAYVNEKLGKKPDLSYENALCATIKSKMRDRLKQCGVPIPKYYAAANYEAFSEAVDKLDGDCIVKPADNAGSRGVVQLAIAEWNGGEAQSPCVNLLPYEQQHNTNAQTAKRLLAYNRRIMKLLRETYDYSLGNARNGMVMVEEYMHGAEVSVEIMVIDGAPHILTITDKYITPPPYFVELAHCEPSGLDAGTQEERLGGDFITSRLVPLSTGIDMVGASVLLATGEEPDLTPKWDRGAAIHFISAGNEPSVITRITVPDALYEQEGVEEICLYKKPGDPVQGTRSSNDRLGHVITTGETPEQAMELGKQILAQIQVEISG